MWAGFPTCTPTGKQATRSVSPWERRLASSGVVEEDNTPTLPKLATELRGEVIGRNFLLPCLSPLFALIYESTVFRGRKCHIFQLSLQN
jgi:hypothetical protein